MREPHDPDLHRGLRVVLTGGPGAGKTAIVARIAQRLGEQVAVVPEAASLVFGAGHPWPVDEATRRAAQLAIFRVQEEVEAAVALEPRPALVLCDRGLIDGAAYWPGPADELYRASGTSEPALLARYDVVVHLAVPSDAQGYNHDNPVRTESADEARAIDRRILDAWARHPRRIHVESTDDFEEKVARTLDALAALLPPCCRAALVAPQTDASS